MKGDHLHGYVQFFGISPFVMHLYTEEQLKILKKYSKVVQTTILHFDGTGQILKRIEEKQVFYYPIVLHLPEYPPLPIAELFTNEHSNITISHFLSSVLHKMNFTPFGLHLMSLLLSISAGPLL